MKRFILLGLAALGLVALTPAESKAYVGVYVGPGYPYYYRYHYYGYYGHPYYSHRWHHWHRHYYYRNW